jgi:predicted NBD/HSP70 family sugar kinase
VNRSGWRCTVEDEAMNVIGLDIGGTKCAVIRPDLEGLPREVKRFPTTNVRDTLKEFYADRKSVV